MASAAEQLAANLKFDTFRKAKDLHKRIVFTLGAMVIYRFGTFIPIPGIDPAAFAEAFSGQSDGLLGMANIFSGGAVERMAVLALNVMPYISASIIVQLLGTMYPPWEKLRKEGGEAGRNTLNQYTRYLTVVLAFFQAFAIATTLQATPGLVPDPGVFFMLTTIVSLTGGAMFLMWLGEQVTSRGLGNGVSLIIFAGIVAVLPRSVWQLFSMVSSGSMSTLTATIIGVTACAVIVFIVFMERAQRRLFTQHPRRQADVRTVGAASAFLPLKVNTSGVMAPIFASSLLLLPATVMGVVSKMDLPSWASWAPDLVNALQHGQPAFMVFYGALIVFFCFFYTSIMFNPEEVADNLRKSGGFLGGVRPGKQTAAYLDYVMSRITVIGAAYITLVCLLPEILISSYGIPFYLGGTSILILVSVTMDTVSAVQAHLISHQYTGLIRSTRLPTSRPAPQPL